jgi:putative RNA 2'-phosphotransferase
MGLKKSPQQLAKILLYILGRCPDEFGLVPDREGYVKIKELLRAFSEEEGWHYVRRSHLDEVRLSLSSPPVEIKDNLIRAKTRENLPGREPATDLPKLLYSCVRQKAHSFVAANGIRKSEGCVVLSSNLKMAERLGRRIDRSAVTLTVQVKKALEESVDFFKSGGDLYTADFIPAGCFTGPPLPKEKPDRPPPADTVPTGPKKPGSYTIDISADGSVHSSSGNNGGKKDPPWKKKQKRDKQKHEKPPWRR